MSHPVQHADTLPALVLQRYRLVRRLGSGGFGTVWLAHDERLDRQVAVKILARERVIGGRFEREARAAARLAHPGIVTLYEAAVDDEGAYLVSELVHGSTLEELLTGGQLSDRDVLQVAVALCDALAHAHAHGVIHRDVKPSNVLVPDRRTTPAQLARLTDFGVARPSDAEPLTRTGLVVGTARFVPPEVMRGRRPDERSDLYACGVLLHECLRDGGPQHLRSLADRLTSEQPEDRPASATEVLELAERPVTAATAVLTSEPASGARTRPTLAMRRRFRTTGLRPTRSTAA